MLLKHKNEYLYEVECFLNELPLGDLFLSFSDVLPEILLKRESWIYVIQAVMDIGDINHWYNDGWMIQAVFWAVYLSVSFGKMSSRFSCGLILHVSVVTSWYLLLSWCLHEVGFQWSEIIQSEIHHEYRVFLWVSKVSSWDRVGLLWKFVWDVTKSFFSWDRFILFEFLWNIFEMSGSIIWEGNFRQSPVIFACFSLESNRNRSWLFDLCNSIWMQS